jgi:hypothetical protein
MKRVLISAAAALAILALAPPAAQAAFGLNNFEVTYTNPDGSSARQAGSHPFAMTTSFGLNYTGEGPFAIAEGKARDVLLEQVTGLTADVDALPRCSTADFLREGSGGAACPIEAAIGLQTSSFANADFFEPPDAIFNLPPPPGAAARIGWKIRGVPVIVDLGLTSEPEYNAYANTRGINQTLSVFSVVVELWGVPSDPAHDILRGHGCASNAEVVEGKRFEVEEGASKECASNASPVPFLTMPRSCPAETLTTYEARSWQEPDLWDTGSHSGPSLLGCGKLDSGFSPSITAQPTSKAAQSPTGLDFGLHVDDEGLGNPKGLAAPDISKTVVTLPEGMSVNPSQAEGLEVCSEDDLARETLNAAPGEGCPEASKIGTLEVESPQIAETLKGSLYVAEPYNNPFDSLLALYIVVKDPGLGILFKLPAEVRADPVTGRLTTIAEDLPQQPFSHFRLHFREGARSPLVTPPRCGTHEVRAELYPSTGGAPITSTSAFQVISGSDGGPCPTGGLPPFKPGLVAGTINNRAGSFSPFNVRLHRTDSEQEFTNFSIKLPPGIVAKLSGVSFCPDTAIAAAKARTGSQGGHEEQAAPSCPASSEIGRTLAGAGVGPALTYAPGKIYLAGPYNGSALSIVAITAGVVGPFDIGTVVVRFALRVDPETAEVFIDATGSDPIPHIIQGIPVHLRDIRAYNDRPNFVLNPTSCERTSTASTLLGSGLDFASLADDNPVTVSTPFQAADCAALPFAPKLSFKLLGGTKRGSHPKLKAHLKMNGIGEAAVARAQVTLPRTEFIENAHFNTICTRVQFKAGPGNGEMCPAGSIYGFAKAVTPILDEPLQGPVFLRSSEHQLPDVVASLRSGKINVHLVGRVDSVKGQLRNTFEVVPDAPVSTFDLTLLGGKKGLFVNSTDLCKDTHRAKAQFNGQNGKVFTSRPELRAVGCAKVRKAEKRRKRAAARDRRAAR